MLRGEIEGLAPGALPNTLNPFGIWVTPDGTTYIADTSLQRIRAVRADGTVQTVAGTGRFGYHGDGGPATEAFLSNPPDVAVDREGAVYVADAQNHCVRKITPYGNIIQYVGTGSRGPGDLSRKARYVDLNTPTGLFVDDHRNLFIADQGNDRVLRVSVGGDVSVVAGGGAGNGLGDGRPATEAHLRQPTDVWVEPDGTLTIADRSNHRIRQVSPDGVIRTIAGNGVSGYAGDGQAAPAAKINSPWSVAVDGRGRVFIADTGNAAIRMVGKDQRILTLAIPAVESLESGKPYGVFVDPSGFVFFSETENNLVRKLESVSSSWSVDAWRAVVPADGSTPAGVTITSSGAEWESRLLQGLASVVPTVEVWIS